MECTYGRPQYVFPDRSQVERDILDHVQGILEGKKVPVILAYALGRSQEMIKLFTDNGFPVAVENRVFDLSAIYEEFGVALGPYERFNPEDFHGRVLIFPPHLWKSPVLTKVMDRHTVAVTGWAVDDRQNAWYQSDASFTLSDHADFEDLIRYIEAAKPKVVSLIHGFKEFAEHIQGLGIATDIVAGLI
jgi:Cft2 family RNA processing exonuclease